MSVFVKDEFDSMHFRSLFKVVLILFTFDFALNIIFIHYLKSCFYLTATKND